MVQQGADLCDAIIEKKPVDFDVNDLTALVQFFEKNVCLVERFFSVITFDNCPRRSSIVMMPKGIVSYFTNNGSRMSYSSSLEVSVSGDDCLYLGRNSCNELENLGIVAVKYDVTIRKAIE